MGTYVPPTPLQNFIDKKGPVVGAAWLNAVDALVQGSIPADGVYQPAFISGQVQLTGPLGKITSYGDLTFGLSIPSPAGGNWPGLIIGGAGKDLAQITTDAQIPGKSGITLFLVAGSTDPTSDASKRGGVIWIIGGGSTFGGGGHATVQGGTSVHNSAGDLNLFGGNSTDGAAGNVYIAAGVSGNQGGNVKIYCTNFGGGSGDISFWVGQPDIPHSVPLWTMSHTGALFPGNTDAGDPGDTLVSAGNLAAPIWGPVGISGNLNLTMSGSMSVTPAPFKYAHNGRQVSIWAEQFIVGNSTGFSDIILSTLPGNLIPSLDRYVPCSMMVDNSVLQFQGMAHIDTLGGITLSLINMTSHAQAILNAWSATGQKGISTGWSITYPT